MYFEDNTAKIRREVLKRVAELQFGDALVQGVHRIPYEMAPRDGVSTRCCVHKDRAVLRYRVMAALGLSVEDETDETIHLNDYAQSALMRSKPEGPILTVIDEACRSCIRTHYFVTNACRGCVARPCVTSCPKKTIHMKAGHAEIDPDNCVNCGICKDKCPYHAIVYVPVPCEEACPVGAISKGEHGREVIDYEKCTFCGKCMHECPFGAIMERSQTVDVIRRIKEGKSVVAMVAPSVEGQFPAELEKLHTAIRALGFAAMEEVARGADITAAHEAEELREGIAAGKPFLATSCCPSWVRTAERHVEGMAAHVSHTGTPMHYAAQLAETEYPGALRVFIGPCVAKRHEALSDGGVDYVLTFEELSAMFRAKGIDPAACEPTPLSQPARRGGRGFAASGGVKAAVAHALAGSGVDVQSFCVNGITKKSLPEMKRWAKGENLPGNFLEVMSCEGGCLSGPGVLVNPKFTLKKLQKLLEASAEV